MPTASHWGFGDGRFFNGTGPAYAEPVHRYNAPGAYVVSATVFEGSASASQSLPITAAPAPLRVVVQATNTTGAAPLTVRFAAEIAGGRGTFRSVLGSFGDGGSGAGRPISYSFGRAGEYPVAVNVIDSAGASSTGRITINVSGGVPVEKTPEGRSTYVVAGAVIGAAEVGVVLGLLVARWRSRRVAQADDAAEEGPETFPPPVVPLTAAPAEAVATPVLPPTPPEVVPIEATAPLAKHRRLHRPRRSLRSPSPPAPRPNG